MVVESSTCGQVVVPRSGVLPAMLEGLPLPRTQSGRMSPKNRPVWAWPKEAVRLTEGSVYGTIRSRRGDSPDGLNPSMMRDRAYETIPAVVLLE